MKHGADDKGRFWFPVPAQIVQRCEAWCDAEEGKQRVSAVDMVAEWKRDKELHPENYCTDDETAAILQRIQQKLNKGRICAGMSDEQIACRQQALRAQVLSFVERENGASR